MSGLVNEEYAADLAYGLPTGTMYAIGQTESGNGANEGSIGNIFQVTPATEQTYDIDGNNPDSVAGYVAGLYQATGGNIAQTLQLYQNGPNSSLNTPAQYSPTSADAQLVADYGTPSSEPDGNPYGDDQTNTSASQNTGEDASYNTDLQNFANSLTNPSGPGADASDPAGAAAPATQAAGQAAHSALFSWLPSWLQLGAGAIAVIMILIGLVALAFRTETGKAAVRAVTTA